jgi:hypothetical protein
VTTILYSADYELYLGENFLPEVEVLVEPTTALLAACERMRVPLTLFCDVACLWRYRDEGDDSFPEAVEAQLKGALGRGHDVQAHIHPHWLHARRENGRWHAPPDTFALGALEDPAPLLARAKAYLEELLQPVDPSYSCIAFRAGCYGIQPGFQRLFAALRETGYEVDSSIVPGLVLRNEISRVDFRGWRWPEKSGLVYDVYEVPIATARFGPPDALFRWLNRPAPRELRGRTIQAASGVKAPFLSGLFRLYPLELGRNTRRLEKITRRYLRRVGKDVEFALSCHPKAVDEPELDALAAYHDWLRRSYDVEALTFRELVDRRAAGSASTSAGEA